MLKTSHNYPVKHKIKTKFSIKKTGNPQALYPSLHIPAEGLTIILIQTLSLQSSYTQQNLIQSNERHVHDYMINTSQNSEGV